MQTIKYLALGFTAAAAYIAATSSEVGPGLAAIAGAIIAVCEPIENRCAPSASPNPDKGNR